MRRWATRWSRPSSTVRNHGSRLRLRSPGDRARAGPPDEAFLTYRRVGFPRSPGYPAGASDYRFAEAGGGVVVCGLRDVGRWNGCRDKGLSASVSTST